MRNYLSQWITVKKIDQKTFVLISDKTELKSVSVFNNIKKLTLAEIVHGNRKKIFLWKYP